MSNQTVFYWDLSGMTRKDLGGYFKLVQFDECGFSTMPMTEAKLDDEMQSFAHEFGYTEEQTMAYMMERVVSEAYRDMIWERYLQTAEQEG